MPSGSIKRRIAKYLADEIQRGKRFFKSKEIAENVGSTPKQVANLLVMLQDGGVFEITKQAYSKSTTWKIELRSRWPRDVYLCERAISPFFEIFAYNESRRRDRY
jgi:transcription initiation factor IIE alpha subunit